MDDAIENLLLGAAQAKREGRPAEAKQDLLRALDLLRQQPSGVELAQALRLLGEVERKLHDGEAARQHYEEAVALCRVHGDTLLLAHTVRHLGDVHHDAGRNDLAEPSYREALSLYRSYPDTPPLELANAIRSMALLKSETGEAVDARQLWEEARDLYAVVGVSEGVAESAARLARLNDGSSPLR